MITRRIHHHGRRKPLSGFAMDISIRVNDRDEYFVHDHNQNHRAQRFETMLEVMDYVISELRRNELEHDPTRRSS